MQILVIILVAIVAVESRSPTDLPQRPWLAIAAAVGLPALALALHAWLVRSSLERLDARHPRGVEAVHRAETVGLVVPWVAVVGTAIATMGFGLLETVRGLVGNLPAIDELLVLLPALAAMAATWWIGEPIERRVREASLIRRLDAGQSIMPSPSRAAFVLERCRSGVLLMLVPILIVIGVGECLVPVVSHFVASEWREWAAQGTMLVSAFLTYLVSPLVATLILSLRPLPPGTLRDDLLSMCEACGVRVRGVMLWDTSYATVNGAVMGIVGPLRYVMLTDALLEALPREQIRAVMAHELGHVRRRHLVWMLGAMLVLLAISSLFVDWCIHASLAALYDEGRGVWTEEAMVRAYLWASQLGTLAAAALALVGFGWISRRFERQADAFAVQYLSRTGGGDRATPEAISAMRGALLTVADSAGVDPEKSSWRHGSIAWRRRNLLALADVPIDRFAIDRLVRRLKLVTACGLIGVGALLWHDLAASSDYDSIGEATDAASDGKVDGVGHPFAHDHSRDHSRKDSLTCGRSSS